MKSILVVGAGTFQLPLVQSAARNNCVYMAAPKVDKRFEPYITGIHLCDVRDEESILRYARDKQIAGVITDQTDIAVRTVAYVAEKLGLPGIGYETACLFTDKAKQRERMNAMGIKLLSNRTVRSMDEALAYFQEIGGSVIIKPADNQGSRGVFKCDCEEEIKRKFDNSISYSPTHKVVIEKNATGREFVVEGIAVDYEFKNLNCGDTEYFDIPDAFAAKTRIFPTTADRELEQRILDLNKKIITGFGLRQGITHSEFIMDDDEIYLIETAARGGGVFISSDLISLSTGLDTEQFLIEIAMGERHSLPAFEYGKQACGYMAFYIPDGEVICVEGLETVLSYDFVHRNQLDELTVGRRYVGGQKDKTTRLAIIVSGKTREQVEERMDLVRRTLQVTVRCKDGDRGLIWE